MDLFISINHLATVIVFVFQKPNTLDPTLTSWEDFEISDEDIDLPDLPRKTISDGSTPWNNFKDLVIGQRYTAVYITIFTNTN